MERIKEVVKELLASRDYSSCMTKTLDLILNDKMNSLELNKCLSDNNSSIGDIKPKFRSTLV